MSRFVHSSLVSVSVPIALRIDNFSRVIRKGYYESREFGDDHSDSKWSLVMYANEVDDYADFIDIHLRRNTSDSKDQFVELKLTIYDYFGLGGLSEKRQFYFNDSKTVQKVISVPRGWYHKLRFLPNDTLTVRGEITIYKENEMSFDSQGEFESSLETSGATPIDLVRQIPWMSLMYVAATTCGYFVATVIRFCIQNVIVPITRRAVLPFIWMLATWLFFYVRNNAKKILPRWWFKGRHNTRGSKQGKMSLVPVRNWGNQQAMKYNSGDNIYGKPKKYGKLIYDLGNGSFLECEVPQHYR